MNLLRKPSHLIGAGCFIIGVVWLSLTAAAPFGLVSAYPPIPMEAITGPQGRTTAPPHLADLYQLAGEGEPAYFKRLVDTTSSGFVHFWPAHDQSYVGVSLLDNWILWLLSNADAFSIFSNYEFASPEKALNRGYGFCSQISYAIYMILRDQGYDANVLMHANHVVVEVDGYILDGDFGVTIPHSSEWLQQHPDEAASHYDGSDLLRQIYQDGWRTRTDHEDFLKYQRFERVSDALKWLPGILLLLFGAATWQSHRRPRSALLRG